jgi:membrane-bound lytic murein transglycosylase D
MSSTRRLGPWLAAGLVWLAVTAVGCSTTAPSKARISAEKPAVTVPEVAATSSAPAVAPAPAAVAATTAPATTPDAAPGPLTGGPPAVAVAAEAKAPRVLDKLFPQPPALDRDVNFWIRVYTEVGTNAGFMHDQYNLGVVYETLQFGPDTTSRQREHLVEAARTRIVAALRRIANATGTLSPEDQHIRDMWGDAGTPARLLSAVEDVRFQLGQADRFRDGLLRAGLWQEHIVETLANLGMPAELAVVPHVESSFNAAAYSKAGAAGLWQFMRSTGRRYMRIDSAVDDRMDPFRATEAAAQLLSFNYRLLGTWPLALTAYNHGAEGMRRAKEQVGSDDIVMVLRNYHSPSFGFASRNYYVSFLAALTVDRDPEKYFGPIKREPEAKFREVTMPGFVTVSALTHALHINADELRRLNPALLPACWQGRRRVPQGYVLRLPLSGPDWTSEMLAARLSPADLQARQSAPEIRRVRKGETLASIAADYGMKPGELARLNGISARTHVRPGRPLRVPEANPVRVSVARVDRTPDHTAAPAESSEVEAIASSSAPQSPASTAGDTAAASAASSAPVAVAANAPSPPAAAAAPVAGAPATPPGSETVAATAAPAETTAGGVSPQVAQQESEQDALAVAQDKPLVAAQPVSAKQAEEITPGLGPTSVVAADNADATDYSVAGDDTIVVAPTETLGGYAGWLQVSPARLRTLNHLRGKGGVRIGRKLKLDFEHRSHEQFEAQRRDYHRQLEAAYFASHRISGTQVHVVRSGDSLWSLTHRFGDLPEWLLQQYNPDVAFDALRTGTQIVVPRVADLGNADADK